MNSGTSKMYPVSKVAFLRAFAAVLPLTPGSHSLTSRGTFSFNCTQL